MSKINSICVYCGSQNGTQPEFAEAAREVGQSFAEAGIRLVYGGGGWGIMGELSRSVLAHGGSVTGIIPKFLMNHEGSHDANTPNYDVLITDNMHERKRLMFEHSDAFLALPGGIGTLEEIVEIMTWAQLGQHEKPIGYLNTQNFWQPMIDLLDHMQTSGFIHTANRVKPLIIDDPNTVVSEFRG